MESLAAMRMPSLMQMMHKPLLLAFAVLTSAAAKDIPVADTAAFTEAAKTVAAGDTIVL